MIITHVTSFLLCTPKQKETYRYSTNNALVIIQFTELRSDKTALHLTVQNKPFFRETCSICFLFNIFNSNLFVNSLHFPTSRYMYIQSRYIFTKLLRPV